MVAGVFPQRASIEIKLVPIETVAPSTPAAGARVVRLEIPEEFRTLDLTPSPWKILPDGSVRFDEASR